MFSTFLTATLFSALAIRGAFAQNGFTLYTIELNQCEPARITWSEATPPYNLAVVPLEDPCNSILADLGDHEHLSMTWPNVTVPAGTQVYLSLLDSSNQEAWSAAITVGEGSSDFCLSSTSSDAASATEVATVSEGATTLTLTSSFSASASSESETATVVGAANAGTLGNAPSGAMSSVRLPTAATLLASVAGIAAVLAL